MVDEIILKKFVLDSRAKGYSDDEIRNVLLKRASSEVVDRLLVPFYRKKLFIPNWVLYPAACCGMLISSI